MFVVAPTSQKKEAAHEAHEVEPSIGAKEPGAQKAQAATEPAPTEEDVPAGQFLHVFGDVAP